MKEIKAISIVHKNNIFYDAILVMLFEHTSHEIMSNWIKGIPIR